ncbi:MAG: hypothetical protein JWM02_3125 [Frankiales bacterium]|nr:hypothetical protein [Frankiales bacterium]
MPDSDLPDTDEVESDSAEAVVAITINGAAFEISAEQISGAQLRQIPFPAIGNDHDLWLEQPGEPDRYVRDDELLLPTDGMRVFTAPRSIMAGHVPGRDAAS